MEDCLTDSVSIDSSVRDQVCGKHTLKKSAVVTGTSSGRSDFSRRPSFTSSSKLIISVLPHRASRPEYGDQKTSSGGTSGNT